MGTSVEDLCMFMTVSCWNISDKFVQKIKLRVLYKITSRKSCLLFDPVEKYVRPRQATDDNTTDACALHAVQLRLQTNTQNM